MWLPRIAAAVVLTAAVIAFMRVRPTPDPIPMLAAVPTLNTLVPYSSSWTPVRPEISRPSERPSGPPVDDTVKTTPGGAEEESQTPQPEQTEDPPVDRGEPNRPKPPPVSIELPSTSDNREPKPPPPADTVVDAKISHRVEPVYPPLARAADIEGDVMIEADCGIDGRLSNLTIVRSADRVLEAPALNAVRQYQCTPRQRNGQPEVSRLPVLVSFRLK